MNADPPADFRDFLAELASYPRAFTDAAWLLRRLFDEPSPGARLGAIQRVLAPLALEKLSLRGQLGRPRCPDVDVLVSLFPARADYRDLLVPAVEAMRRRGLRCAVALPPRSDFAPRSFAGAPTFDLWNFATPLLYARARGRFGRLNAAAGAFSQRYGLDRRRRAYLTVLLQTYSWQAELFTAALAAARPHAILGVHFMENPGFLPALREAAARGHPVTALLLQHGVFSHAWETHDFHGADRVLVWGPQSQRELAAFPGPTPPSTIVGHTRLEALLQRRSRRPRPLQPQILVLGTNDLPEREHDALLLAAQALPDGNGRRVTFRPHPSEPEAPYRHIVETGLARPDQIRRDGDVYDALLSADVVVGTQTTVLPEAVVLGIPAIQLLPERLEVDWRSRGMASASDPAALSALVDDLLADPAARERTLDAERPLAFDLLGKPGGAAERVADAVALAVEKVDGPGRAGARAGSRGPNSTGAARAGMPADPTPSRVARGATGLRTGATWDPTTGSSQGVVPDRALVTIAIPTYGQAAVLPRAIESALAQDYPALEVLVVDDASPDATQAVAAAYASDPRVRVVRHATNLGRVATYRDTLFNVARGRYVLNLDGDDWLCDPHWTSTAVELLDADPGVAVAFARASTYHEATHTMEEDDPQWDLPEIADGNDVFRRYALGAAIPHPAAVYRRELALEADFYAHDVLGSDSVSFLLLLPGRRVAYVDRVVAVWRRHAGNASVHTDTGALIRNLAVADVPAVSPAARAAFSPPELRRWRRRMAAHLAYRAMADQLGAGRPATAAAVAGAMLVTRPGALAVALAALGAGAWRSLRRAALRGIGVPRRADA